MSGLVFRYNLAKFLLNLFITPTAEVRVDDKENSNKATTVDDIVKDSTEEVQENTVSNDISTAKVAEYASFDNVTTEEVEVLSTDGMETKMMKKLFLSVTSVNSM